MRRATSILGLALPAVAVALVALVYGVGSDQPSSTVEPRRGEAKQAQQTSSTETEPNESTGVVPRRSTDSYQKPAVTEGLSDVSLADENTVRKMVREEATRDVQEVYSLLFEDLDLTPSEKDALLSLLIEDRIASTWTDYKRGETIDKEEQSRRIAAIIGGPKLQQFRALERNLFSYGEVQRIGSLLQQNDVPLTDTQRDGLLKILVETQDQYLKTPASDAKRDPIESLEHTLTQIDEYQRHVMELAPSVLSARQVVYLDKQYQYLSYQRASALELQRKKRADDPDVPVGWYPAWSD